MNSVVRNYVMFATALLLLSAIGLHLVISHHEHPSFMGEKIEAALHGESKKWLLIAVLIITLSLQTFQDMFSCRLQKLLAYVFSRSGEFGVGALKTRTFLVLLLRSGILHPKSW